MTSIKKLVAGVRVTVDEYDKLAEKTDNRMCEIDAELIGLEQPDESDEMTMSKLLNLAKKRRRAIQKFETCREEPNFTIISFELRNKAEKAEFNLLEPFNIIKKLDSRPIWLPGLDSNQQPRS